MESFFYQLSGSIFSFVKKTHQKAANLMFCLILPVAKVPWLFLEVQSRESIGHYTGLGQRILVELNPNILVRDAVRMHSAHVLYCFVVHGMCCRAVLCIFVKFSVFQFSALFMRESRYFAKSDKTV